MINDRYWQIDVIRGMAVVGMVIYHFLVDVELLFGIPIGVYKFPVIIMARIVATLFIVLAGVSASIKFERLKQQRKVVFLEFGKKTGEILFWAGIVSSVTYVMFPGETVWMGILHFLGIATILIVPFLYIKNNLWLGIMGTVLLILGLFIPRIETTNYWLLPLGIVPKTFGSLDYFPIIPWFGLMLLGVILGRTIVKKLDGMHIKTNSKLLLLSEIGQKSLLVYLLHQPVMWGLLTLISRL